MSQDTEPQLSQGSLAPPVEISGPMSPTQRPSLSVSPELSVGAGSQQSQSQSNKNKFFSPPPLSSSEMTPPPSSQPPGAPLRRSRSRESSYRASPPDMEKTLYAAYGASENLPTAGEIDSADETRLRAIAKDLLGVAQESRMSALHFKLQNSLASFASNEAIKRAEVEHQLARREVEILQSPEYRNRSGSSEVKLLQASSNVELEHSLKQRQELERTNTTLDRRLRKAKKLIEQEREKSDLLAEETILLKKRIRDNRVHFSRMIAHGSLTPSPRTEFQTPHRRNVSHYESPQLTRSESHDPFAALLAADKVLNRESSMASAHRACGQRNSNGHMHHHSVSSMPMTPMHSRTVRAEHHYLTPGHNTHGDRRDRDSTISVSDPEEAETDIDAPDSHGSSLAHHGPVRQEAVGKAPKSSALLQTKLFGQVKKPGVEPPNLKRKASSSEESASKRSRAVGLGIH